MKKVILLAIIFCSLLIIPSFNVKADSSQLLFQRVETKPEIVEPGQQFTINFFLKNISSDSISDINIKLASIEGKNALSGFSPVNSTNEVYCSKISKNDTAVLSLDMIADAQLKTGTYNIVINISYKYNDTVVQDSKIIGIVIDNKANLDITSVNSSDTGDSEKDLKVAFVNASKGTLDQVMAKVTSNGKEFSQYYGSLDSGDNETYEVTLPFTKDINGKIEVSYTDELNRTGVVSKDLNIKKLASNNEKISSNNKKSGISSIGDFFKRLFGLGD